MDIFQNIDLFFLGTAVAAIGILGFTIFFNNPRGITHRTFLLFTLATSFYSIFNYFAYQFTSPNLVLWFLRVAIFFVVWHAFNFFQLAYIFFYKNEQKKIAKWYTHGLLPVVYSTSLLTLTPLVFNHITEFSLVGRVAKIANGPALPLFGFVVIGLILMGIILLYKRMIKSKDEEKARFTFLFLGSLITFPLYIVFNFILPALFDNPDYVPFAPIFSLPFVAMTAYSVIKYHLLDIKVLTTEIISFLLVVGAFFEVLLSKNFFESIFRSGIFVVLLVFSILLIRSVRKEVEQRERLEILTKQLGEANEELKKLDAAKSEFISIASHQLRAPLTVIKGYVSLAIENSLGPIAEQAKEALGKVMFAANQLVKLVSDLLDLSRIESGKIHYEIKPTDFVAMVSKIVDEFQENAKKKSLALAFANSAGALPQFNLDPDKIREAVVNLTDNGIKYTEKGSVSVSLDRAGEKAIRLSVKDQGLGIKKEDLARLFTKFSRTEEARLQDPNGMGIGLYFVKRVIEDHGGRVGAESEGMGKGSTFWVELPIK